MKQLRPTLFVAACVLLGSARAYAQQFGGVTDGGVTASPAFDAVSAIAGATLATTGTTRKYHPGHYITLLRKSDSQGAMASAIQPGVVGLLKHYSWPSLEPSKGTYDFSEIASDLNWAAAHGMRLVVMIEDKTFTNEIPTPAYLSQYVLKNHGGGYTTLRWKPAVAAAFKALVVALGTRFDSNKYFEGLATQETAVGFPYKVLVANGYTAEAYRDMYIALLTAAAKAMPTSRVFWFMNFIPVKEEYVGTIATAVAPLGVAMGGPDIMPENKHLLRKPYPYYTQFFGKMPLFGQVEGACYDQLHMTSGYLTKYWTMPELYSWALKNLHVNYIFWVRITTPAEPDAYDWLDALPVIAEHSTFKP